MKKLRFIFRFYSIPAQLAYFCDTLLLYIGSAFLKIRPAFILHRKQFSNILFQRNISYERKNGIIKFHYPIHEVSTKLCLRENDSDVQTFLQIIYFEEYKPVLELLSSSSGALKIIDGGSNIGLTALYFKTKFPDSEIICIEPSEENCRVLKKNLEENKFTNIHILQKALWNKDCFLSRRANFRDNLSWSYSVEEKKEKSDDSIEAITISSILKSVQWEYVDLLKLDIEGAEASLFNDSKTSTFLFEHSRIIALEVHEEFISRLQINEQFRAHGFRVFQNGELIIGLKNKFN